MVALITAYTQNMPSQTAGYTTPSFTPAVGEVIIIKIIVENTTASLSAPTNTGGFAVTQRVHDFSSSNCEVGIYSIVPSSATSMTITAGVTGTGAVKSVVIERWSNAQLAATPATASTRGSGAPSTTLTTTAANSVVSWACGDWGAIDGTSRAYRSSATEDNYDFNGSAYTAYYAYQTAASAGSQTIGLTAPTGQTWNLLGVEIQDSGGGSLAAPTGLTATAVSSSQIDLSWNAVTGATGYDIERDGAVIATDNVTTSYSDTGLTQNTTYTYRVRTVG